MQNVFTFPDGRKFALFYSVTPAGAVHRQNTPLRSQQDIDQLMSYLGGAKLAGIWQDYYVGQTRSQTASPTAPIGEMRKRIKADLWQGNLYFLPRDDPEDKPENIDQAIRTARAGLQMHLRGIIQDEQKEKSAKEQEYNKLNVAEKALASSRAAATGLGKAAKDFLIWADNIADVVDMNRRAVRFAKAAKQTYWEQNKKTWGENIAEAEYKELVEALGFDPNKITREQIKQGIEFAQLIWEDQETRDLLKQFALDYARAQHHTEWTEMAGGLSFEIILTLILAALTGGAAGVAMAAKNMLMIGRLEKAGQSLLTIGKKLKSIKVRKKRKLVHSESAPTASGPAPKSKYDKADEAMHKASEKTDTKPKPEEKKGKIVRSAVQDREAITNLSNESEAARKNGNHKLADAKLAEARDILKQHIPQKPGDTWDGFIERLDVNTPKDGAVLWSGNQPAAQKFADSIGGSTLEGTPGGRVINGWEDVNQIPWRTSPGQAPGSGELWNGVSEKFAQSASGEVHVVQRPDKLWEQGTVWHNTEKPIIKNSIATGQVSKVNMYVLDGDSQPEIYAITGNSSPVPLSPNYVNDLLKLQGIQR